MAPALRVYMLPRRVFSHARPIGRGGHMCRLASLIVTVMAVMAPAAAAWAGVAVTYVHPESFSDTNLRGGYGEKARAPALDGIRQHFERLSQRYLKHDQTLTIEVLDLDLAGRFEPWHANAYDVRYMRDITWPRMTLRYTLVQNGLTLAQGEETISDMSYLMDASARLSSDSLRYEKTMLDSWFRKRIVRNLP
jgi:hypothetical protein